ncbi:hypothetical protein [Winogradskyella sp.]|uniref:hypothetical protein n=1 Tax=Winogradskyella sp. TaxID=1883156 RepID=UPI0026296739|nr:hypothetical protein [Winogradskyella sp.]
MKSLCLIIGLLFLAPVLPKNPIEDITLDKNHKVESTFSGNIDGEDSFHLIIAKNLNAKTYDIIPYHYSSGEVIKLKTISFSKLPNVLSFHNNDNVLSLIAKSKEGKSEKIRVLDLDLKTGETKKSDSFSTDDFKAIIRQKNRNVLLYADKESIKLVDATSAISTKTINVKPDESALEFFKTLSNNSIDAINNNEFVANGSINDFRAYFEENTLTITQEDTKEGLTNMIQIPMENGNDLTVVAKELKSESVSGKIKKSTSYFSEDKLYQLRLNKDEAKLDVFDLSNASNKTVDMLEDSFKSLVSNKNKSEGFLKNSSKNSNAPTLTTNKANNGNIKLRFDYVNKNTYKYRYNWWWHHHWMMQQMMWHQQQQMHMRASGFGPNPIEDIYWYKEEQTHFEIGLDNSGNLISTEGLETVHKDIDKKKYVDELDENKS